MAGPSPFGPGNFWAIESVCLEDFAKGNFQRRRARQRVQNKQKNASQKKSGAHTAVTSGAVNLDSYVPMTATTLTDCHPYYQLGRYDIRNVHLIPIAMSPLDVQCQDSDEKALDQQGMIPI